ncbi:MAG: fibronectin type III domain-containing protein, partial [Candidatus Latescibacteria bacterium]|nr:fibronectin type III domain-containing protein [Candidatus Latescibacterota bacterium]
AITGYAYQYRLAGGTQWDPSWTPLDGHTVPRRGHTVEKLIPGNTYTFEVCAVNDEGAGRSGRTQATAERFNFAPIVDGDPAPPRSLAENNQGVVATCTARDAQGDISGGP